MREIKFCANCQSVLTGKQRSFCSDKCRKAYGRKSDKSGQTDNEKQPISPLNSDTGNVFSLFTDTLTGLDDSGIYQLKLHLIEQAKYSDEWVSRLTNSPSWKRDQRLMAQQAISAILWRMVDDIQMIEVAK